MTATVKIVDGHTLLRPAVYREIVRDTCISNKVSTVPKTLQEYAGFAGNMYEKAQTLFNGWAAELFFDYIASLGVKSVTEYEEPSSTYTKRYGYFVV